MSEVTEELQQVPTQAPGEPSKPPAGDTPPSNEGDAQESAEHPTEQPPKRKNDPERRIAQYRARLTRAQEQAEYWRDQALKASLTKPAAENPQPTPPKRPTIQDFGGDIERYSEALGQYTDDRIEFDRVQRDTKTEAERQRQERDRQQQHLGERQRQQVSMLEQGREKFEDFDDWVFDPGLRISTDMLEVATDIGNGPDVLYALAQKPQEAARIAALSGRAVALEMAKFAATMTKPVPKGSGAPPPPKPAKGSGDKADQGDIRDDLPIDEWMKRSRAKRLKAVSTR